MSVDLVVKNGKIVTSSTIHEAGVAVDGGIIVAIAKDGNLPEAEKVVNAKGNFILPGVIDVHVHFREPGLTHEEDFTSGSMAAAVGGVATVIDMPCTITPRQPLTIDLENFKEKLETVKNKSFVDFGLNALIIRENLNQIPKLAEAGVMGYKLFIGTSVGKIPILDDGTLLEAFRMVAKTGMRLMVHAENDAIIQYLSDRLMKEGRTDALAHLASRPSIAEAEAIQRAILFCKEAGNKLHICHMSSKESVELVRSAKERGIMVTSETCPHYLLLESKHMESLGSVLKMNPPIRFREDRKKLWKGLRDGTIDMIASDHSPVALEEKIKDNVWEARGGFVGVETCTPLMLTQVNEGMLTLNKFVELTSMNPANAFGIYPRKGGIQIGSDGDFTIVDLKKEGIIKSEKLHSKTKITPFDGWKIKGMPIFSIVRGNIVMENGEIQGKPSGRLVTPDRFQQQCLKESNNNSS